MERGVWTDARLTDRFDHLDSEIADVRADIRGLRGEIGGLRQEVHAGIGGLREEVHAGIGGLREELRGEIADLRGLMVRLHVASMVVTLGLIAALVARGG